jgi:hypothetical protein
VEPSVNNVFGRAELRRDTACCKFMGQASTLTGCQQLADNSTLAVTSVTFHLPSGTGGSWRGTCYAIIDGTWLPVPVVEGQALADSARRRVPKLTQGAAGVPNGWVSDVV